MSLQNKANTFFGSQRQDAAASDEVEDIFEQYGSGTVATSAPADDDAPQTQTYTDGGDTTTHEPETRAWEREFAQQDTVPAQAQFATRPAPTPAPEPEPSYPSAPPEDDPVQDLAPHASSVASTPASSVASPIDPIVTHATDTPVPTTDTNNTPQADTGADTPPAISPQQPPSPTQPVHMPTSVAPSASPANGPQTQPTPPAAAPQPVAAPETSARYTEPVAAPVERNINAVMENAPDVRVKKSVTPHIPSTAPQTIDPSKKTILIVDDDVDTLEMYATIFEGADYNVLRAADGLEALSIIASYTPHVIFTGVVMPRMDGFTMIDALRQNDRTADIPVVINSHLGRTADKKRAEELGVRDFIVRGFTTPREVVERIGALLLRSEYSFHFDSNDPEARKLAKDLGASNFFTCPRGQEMVLKLSIVDPRELTFSARFSCVDADPAKK